MIWSRYHRTSLCMHSLAGETHPYSRIHQSHFPANGYTRLQDVQPTAACMGYGYVRSKLVAWLGLMSACVYRQPTTMLELVWCVGVNIKITLVYNAVHATQNCMLSLPVPLAGMAVMHVYRCTRMIFPQVESDRTLPRAAPGNSCSDQLDW